MRKPVQATPRGAEMKPSQLSLVQIADLQNWKQTNGSRFEPLKMTWLPLCLSLFLEPEQGHETDEQGSVMWEKTKRGTETRSILSDQGTSQSR